MHFAGGFPGIDKSALHLALEPRYQDV